MTRRLADRRSRADWIVGFIVPLGLFLEVGSPILLATSSIGEDGLFLPISLLVLPFALALFVFRRSSGAQVYSPLLVYAAATFTAYALVMSAVSAITVDSIAIVYGIQWTLTFAWLPYFSTLTCPSRFESFLRGFIIGVLFNVIFYGLSGILEIAMYGGLQDAGRLSQNLVLAGQYQVATYIPTLVAFCFLIVVVLSEARIVHIGRVLQLSIVTLSLLVITFLASRESLLVVVTFAVVYGVSKGGAARVLSLLSAGAVVLVLFNLDALAYAFRQSDFRLFDKIANLANEGSALAGRDVMIADVFQIIEANPIFGSYFLPPNSGVNMLRVEAPSAHNMYIDVFAWTGLLGGLLFCLAILPILFSAIRYSTGFSGTGREGSFKRNIALLVIVFLIISNNINVPMRQPLISPLFAFLTFICLRRPLPVLTRATHAKE